MLGAPFLTLLDPRAKIKGSRDPLGLQPIWTRFGRQVVHNLTTVTTSAREFSVLLLALFFAEQTVENKRLDEAEFVEVFLKFEQLAAYSRYAWRDKTGDDENGVRGIQRVKSRFNEGHGQVRISADQEGQILSNQKTYGLWGLYTVAARNSGWLEPGSPRLNPIARDFVEQEYLYRLDRAGKSVFPFLEKEQEFEPRGKHEKLGRSLASVLSPRMTDAEKTFYAKHLIGAGDEDSAQRALWRRIKQVNQKRPFGPAKQFSMPELGELVRRCRAAGEELLAMRLEHIQHIESVFAPAGALFGFLLSRDGQTIKKVAREIESVWDKHLRHLNPTAFSEALAAVNGNIPPETRGRLSQFAEALVPGQYPRALEILLEQNTAVMKERGGSAWVQTKGREQQIDARFPEEATLALPEAEVLPHLWVNTYFLNSLKSIGYQIEGEGSDV